VPVLEGHGVLDEEGGLDSPFRRLLFRTLDRHFQEVDASDLAAPAGEEQSGVTGPTAGVENRAADLVGRVKETLLRLADVPGRLAGVQRFKSCPVGYVSHGHSLWLPRFPQGHSMRGQPAEGWPRAPLPAGSLVIAGFRLGEATAPGAGPPAGV